MNNLFKEIETLFEAFKVDSDLQVENGNKAAGARARKTSLELEKKFKEFRKLSVEESK